MAVGLFGWMTARQHDLYAFGCDSFGYMRQAELFRQNGLIGGFDTGATAPEARFLVATAKSIEPDFERWAEMVAPHCNHYVATTDKIIIQYPPGTGLILSLFPEDRSLADGVMIGAWVSIATFLLIFVGWRPSAIAMAFALPIPVFFAWTSRHVAIFDNGSIHFSLALIPAAAAAAFQAFADTRRAGTGRAALLLGVVAGFLVTIRIANALLVVGLLATVVILAGLWRPSAIARSYREILAGLAGFALGLLPLAVSNRVNAGDIFSTTYASGDASPPIWDWATVAERAHYYFADGFAKPLLIAGIVAVAAGLAWLVVRPSHVLAAGWAGGAICLAVAAVFFLTHRVTVPYYPAPAALMTLCLVGFGVLRSTAGSAPGTGRILGPALALSAIVLCYRLFMVTSPGQAAELPPAAKAPDAIVWADMTSGTSAYYEGKYAAKIIFAGDCMADRMITAVSAAGRPQFFVDDSDSMARLLYRLKKSASLVAAGSFQARQAYPVWRLDPGWTAQPCT